MAPMYRVPLAICCGLAAFCVMLLLPWKTTVFTTLRRNNVENPIQPPATGKVEKGSPRLAAHPAHPLDALTLTELEAVRELLVDAGLLTPGAHEVHGVELKEPPKATVLAWSPGAPLPLREAYVNTYRDGKIHEIVVDLTNKKVVKDEIYEGTGKPMMSVTDFEVAATVPLTYGPFIEAVKRRGLPLERVFCGPLSAGWYDKAEDGTRRIARTTCYDKQYANFYMMPIEGVTLHVDLDKKEVFHFIDQGVVPTTSDPAMTSYTLDEMEAPLDPPFKPISIEQPEGVNFKVDGSTLSWANWKMHIRPDHRAGLIISRVQFNDTVTRTLRDIMYQANMAEMFVPYQDPSPNWFYRTFMDVGEYGFGQMSLGLIPLNDCPRNAHYIDGVFAGPDGEPLVIPNMICVFERYAGDAVWRHVEPLIPGAKEVRPKVTLVVRQATAVGNYDYTIDWEFQTDGLIRGTITMSGMVNVKAVRPATVNDVANGETLYGTMVNDHTVAVAHDHFINFRLDMDVDGTQNSFAVAKLVTKPLPEGTSWRKSVWDVERSVPKTELAAQYNATSLQPAEYFVVNEASTTRLGNARSYKLVPRTSGVSVLLEDDYPQLRAAWTKNTMWVTPYAPEQRWPGGKFPNQCHGDDTLATWTLKDRAVEKTDIVVWYNVAYHHIPVQEDFPVMPSTLGGFDIKPANFFEANPAIKARAFTAAQMPTCAAHYAL